MKTKISKNSEFSNADGFSNASGSTSGTPLYAVILPFIGLAAGLGGAWYLNKTKHWGAKAYIAGGAIGTFAFSIPYYAHEFMGKSPDKLAAAKAPASTTTTTTTTTSAPANAATA